MACLGLHGEGCVGEAATSGRVTCDRSSPDSGTSFSMWLSVPPRRCMPPQYRSLCSCSRVRPCKKRHWRVSLGPLDQR